MTNDVAADEILTNFLSEHAHKLAEEIRAEADAANIPGSPATPDVIRGMREGADLIDPKVEK